MSYRLFLDDERSPEQASNLFILNWKDKQLLKEPGWIVVGNYEDFCNALDIRGIPAIVSFDHDLGNNVARLKVAGGMSKRQARKEKIGIKNGYDCAKYLRAIIGDEDIHIIVHSMNPVGRENILNLFK